MSDILKDDPLIGKFLDTPEKVARAAVIFRWLLIAWVIFMTCGIAAILLHWAGVF